MAENKLKYIIVNDNNIVATCYENEKFGKILVLTEQKINPNQKITVYNQSACESVKDVDLKDWLVSLIPNN